MKKVILFAFSLFSFITTAQELDFGIKAGTNLSTLSGDFGDDTKSKIGVYGGVLAELYFNENMSLQAELLFSQQGVENNKSYVDRDLNYLLVPITYNYYPIEKLKLTAGAQISYLVSANDKIFGNGWVSEFDPFKIERDFDSKDKYQKLSYDLVIGASYNIWKGFSVDARYDFGLGNLLKENKPPFFSDVEYENGKRIQLKNRTIQLGLSYKF